MIGFPFDSHVTYETDGTPVYDRAISSEPLRNLLHKLFTDGILPDVSTNLQVVAGSGMNVVVKAGFAIVQGCLKLEENDRTLAIQASSATNDRIDTVVLRLNSNDDQRYCDLYIREGTPASNPVRPNLVRSDSVYELGLADIFVSKTITSITQSKITDTRYEKERCGVISSLSEYDTTTIYKQVQADLKEFKDTEQAEFLAWYENIKNILDESTAGHLQNEIDATNKVVATKQDKAIKATITLSTTWNDLIQNVSVSGVTANHNAILDVVTSTSNYEAQQTEWAKVYKAETYDGGIKFYAKEATSTALTIQVLAM
nr:MAG TPA: Receptor Binding Protein [Caudoviricetes sp.]